MDVVTGDGFAGDWVDVGSGGLTVVGGSAVFICGTGLTGVKVGATTGIVLLRIGMPHPRMIRTTAMSNIRRNIFLFMGALFELIALNQYIPPCKKNVIFYQKHNA